MNYFLLFCFIFVRNILAQLYNESDILQEIPLEKVVVHSEIKDTIAEVYVQQTYINNSEDTIEALYKFPLDSEAAVESFEADIDGQSIYAKIYKNDEASKLYEQELEQGNMAFLLDEEYKDVFQVSIGNLKPKQKVYIKLTYVTELNTGNENNKVTFILPNIIAPRYGNNNSKVESKIFEGNPKYSNNVNYTLDLNVELEMSGKINSIESPSHEIIKNISEKKNNVATVTFKSDTVYLEKDFILDIEVEELNISKVLIEYNEELKSYASLLTLMPNLIQNEQLKVEIIFLIDQSGSMHGWKLDYLKDALTLFLKSMPVDSYFNIITFGSLYEHLFDKSVKYSEETLKTAINLIDEMDASMGGTEMRDALEYIYSTEVPEGFNRSIFLLTDGEIWDVDPVIDLVRENTAKQNSVLYTFGIGKSVSHYLVSSIARNGNGMSLFVTEGERLEKKVLLQLKNVLVPYIQDYTISWKEKGTSTVVENEKIEQSPFKLPLMRIGSRYSIYAISDKPLVPSPIEITYKFNDGKTQTETITFDQIRELKHGKVIHSLAASNLIRDLEEGTSKIHYSEEYKKRVESDEQISKMFDTIKEKIIEISTKYQIMSRFTSFLCIKKLEDDNDKTNKEEDKNDDSLGDQLKKVIIPSKGFPMYRERSYQKPLSYKKKRTFMGTEFVTRDIPMEEANSANVDNEANEAKKKDEESGKEIHFRENENIFDISDINLIKMTNADLVEREKSQRLLFNSLIQFQLFDGSFKLSDLLTTIIGPIYGEEFSSEWKKELDGIKKNYQEAYPDIVDQFDKLIGTSIACVILTDYLGELQSEWELVKEKSEKWILQKQKQNPIQDIRQKILISINQKKEHLLKVLHSLQNEDGSLTFTTLKDRVMDSYYGKVLSNEWSKELKAIQGTTNALPSQIDQFNKYLGTALTLNILKNEKFEEGFQQESEKMIQQLETWILTTETQNPIFSRFHKDLESSLQRNRKKTSILYNYMTSFKGDTESFACYRDILKDQLLSGQESDGSFTISSILGKLKEMEESHNSSSGGSGGNDGSACQVEYQLYPQWINEWFKEVNQVVEKSNSELTDDDSEKAFVNSLWGTLVALHLHKEISEEVIHFCKEDIVDMEAFKYEFLYQRKFDKAQKWIELCFNDPKNVPFLSKWWKKNDDEKEEEEKEEEKEKVQQQQQQDDHKEEKDNKKAEDKSTSKDRRKKEKEEEDIEEVGDIDDDDDNNTDDDDDKMNESKEKEQEQKKKTTAAETTDESKRAETEASQPPPTPDKDNEKSKSSTGHDEL